VDSLHKTAHTSATPSVSDPAGGGQAAHSAERGCEMPYVVRAEMAAPRVRDLVADSPDSRFGCPEVD